MRRIVIASNNEHKVEEISRMLEGCDREFLTLHEANIESDPVEDADSFDGNARIKARAAFEKGGGVAVLADDSGLIVDALDGAPGVRSSRYAGEDATDAENNELLLRELDGVALDDRTARFVCTMCYIDEDGNESICEGRVDGVIGFEERGDGGFGYDPLFYPDEYDRELSFSQVPLDEKNRISHRARALDAIKSILLSDR